MVDMIDHRSPTTQYDNDPRSSSPTSPTSFRSPPRTGYKSSGRMIKPAPPRSGFSPARPAHGKRHQRKTQNTAWKGKVGLWQQQDRGDEIRGRSRPWNAGQTIVGGGTATVSGERKGQGQRQRNAAVTYVEDLVSPGEGAGVASSAWTIETILKNCGQSLIEPSAVSPPMDYLTSEAEYRKVWQVFTAWLCSAVSAKLRAHLPRFFSLSYRVFNLGICIPTLELDSLFLERYGVTQEQSLSSKSSMSPRAPQQVTFSRETLGKGVGLPPARASYALEGVLCAIGREAGRGRTLLVDCGVGVLAARGRVIKFTFVQGADSLEVVHRHTPPVENAPPTTSSQAVGAGRRGIHAFGKCYIPYTSRGNKELAEARSRATASLLRAEQAKNAGSSAPDGVEGEEGMEDDSVIEEMRAWDPAVGCAEGPATSGAAAAAGGVPLSVSAGDDIGVRVKKGDNHSEGNAQWHQLLTKQQRDRLGESHIDPSTFSPPPSNAATAGTILSPSTTPPAPPPLIDIHARLRGAILPSSTKQSTTTRAATAKGGDIDRRRERVTGAAGGRGGGGVGVKHGRGAWPLGSEPRGVERLGNHYSPAAQALYLDPERGCIAWRDCGKAGFGVGIGLESGREICLRGAEASGKPRMVSAPARQTSCVSGAPTVAPGELQNEVLLIQPPGTAATTATETTSVAVASPAGATAPPDLAVVDAVGEETPGNNANIKMLRLASPPPPLRSHGTPRSAFAAKRLLRPNPASFASSIPIYSFASPREPSQVYSEVRNGAPCGKEGGVSGADGSALMGPQGNIVPKTIGDEDDMRRVMSGFERYRYYMDHDAVLAASVPSLQPLVIANIIRKGMKGLLVYQNTATTATANCAGEGLVLRPSHDDDPFNKEHDWSVDGFESENSGSRTRAQPDNQQAGEGFGHGLGLAVGTKGFREGAATPDSDNDEASEEDDHFEINGPGTLQAPHGHEDSLPAVAATPAAGDGSGKVGSAGDAEGSRKQNGQLKALHMLDGGGCGSRTVNGVDPVQTGKFANTAMDSGSRFGVGHARSGQRRRDGGTRTGGQEQEVHVPEGLREGVNNCLEGACEAFQRSVRRAILNYVLLDAGQRERLGIAKIPPGFGSEGWGWGKGRGFRESPPEWRRRFSRAREALEVGQIAGSPALLAAQALLVECRDVRLLRLPDSAAAMWSSRWTPLSPEAFQTSQLKRLARTAGNVRRLLYPGLLEALTSSLGGGLGSAPKNDGHVRRYLLAVNVMTASVLRGLVETALADLQAFFNVYSSASDSTTVTSSATSTTSTAATSFSSKDTKAPTAATVKETLAASTGRIEELSASKRNPGLKGATAPARAAATAATEGAALSREAHENRHSGDPGGPNGDNAIGDTDGKETCSARKFPATAIALSPASCPAAFKVLLEESPAAPGMPPELTCRKSLGVLREAVMDVVRGVVVCFKGVPRVAYDCADKAAHPSFARNKLASSDDAGGGDRGGGGIGGDITGDGSSASKSPAVAGASTVDDGGEENTRTDKHLSLYPHSDDGSSSRESDQDGDDSSSDSDSASEELLRDMNRIKRDDSGLLAAGEHVHARKGGGTFLTVLTASDPAVVSTVKAISACIRAASLAASTACKVYEPFRPLLREAVTVKLRAEDVSERDLPKLAESINRYEVIAVTLRSGSDAAPVELPGRLLVVDCEETSGKLLNIAGELSKGALQWVTSTLSRLTSDITKQARTTILKLGKRPRSTAEMAEAIDYLRATRAQEQVELRQRQVWMGRLMDFVFAHGGLQHETVGSVAGVHRVMAELTAATDKAAKAIAEGQAQLQKGVEKAKKRVEDEVRSVQARIEAFIESGGRARDMADKAQGIVKDLEALRDQAAELGEEEVKVDGFTNGALVASVEKVELQFKPHFDVWTLAAAVGPFISSISRSPVTSLNPAEIATEHASMKDRLENVQQLMNAKSHSGPARAAHDALRQLASLEKDIPVVKALSNPRFKDRHWRKFSALAGVTVSSDHPTTLQQLNELDVLTDTKVVFILHLSDEADAEDALERETADIDTFVRDGAVLRVKAETRRSWGEEYDHSDPNNGGGDALGRKGVFTVSRADEDHLKEVLDQAERFSEKVQEVKHADAAKAVAAAHGLEDTCTPDTIEILETALAELERAGRAILKCAQLVPDMETETEEHTSGDDLDREEELKTALEKWQDFLARNTGHNLKDLRELAEAALTQLSEAADG